MKLSFASRCRKPSLTLTLSLTLLLPLPAAAQVWAPPTSAYRPLDDAFPYGAALLGKRIVVSPGHGWTYDNGWGFQRDVWKWTNCGSCDGFLEDLFTAETAMDHLVPLLRQAGAYVYVARELDRQEAEVVVDDGDAGYQESGSWQAGFSPSLGFGADYRASQAKAGGTATWSIDVPADGDYWVSIRYAAGANRCMESRFTIVHGGVQAAFDVDQRFDGERWIYLARLYFPEGGDNRVVLSGPEGEDCYVVADAVRIGGGFDTQVQGGVAANQPRWKMGARWYLPYLGVPASAFPYQNDVVARPFYANWQGADAFLSLHANATGAGIETATGTSTYRYNCGTDYRWEPLDPAVCDKPSGSADLQAAVESRIVGDLRADWDPAWVDQGNLVADFGEVRELDGIPGVLVESAYFDGVKAASGHPFPDNRSLHDPRFRYLLARAMVRATIETLAPGAPLLAEPPTNLVVRNAGGILRASWAAAAGASGYRVYVAVNRRTFDAGKVVSGTSYDLPGIASGDAAYVRVSTLNGAGESAASEAIGARLRTDGGVPECLIVSGYDRKDAYVREKDNAFDYVFEHGSAIRNAAGGAYYFDGASNEALEEADVLLADYRFAAWILGRESTEHETFSAFEQVEVEPFLAGGGCLIASGAEIGWDLVELGETEDQAFFADVLRTSYVADDSGSYQVEPSAGGMFGGLDGVALDDGTGSTYDVEFPDVLAPVDGGRAELDWSNGAGAAAVSFAGTGRVVVLGFPFETIVQEGVRTAYMERMLAFCGPPSEAPLPEPGQDAGAGADAGGDAAGTDVAGEDAATLDDAGGGVPDSGTTGPDAGGIGEEGGFADDGPAGPDTGSVSGDAASTGDMGAVAPEEGKGGGGGGGCAAGGARGARFAWLLVILAGFVLTLGRRRGSC